MKSDKELADELDAKKRLREHGYTQRKCDTCLGVGFIFSGHKCIDCEGKGYTWEAPLVQVADPHIKLLRSSYPEQFPNG